LVFQENIDVFLRLLFKDDEENELKIDKKLKTFLRTLHRQIGKLPISMAENS